MAGALKDQFRSVVQWNDPKEWEIFRRFTDRGDELKNASKLILQPGQGCLFTYEGKVQAVHDAEGMFDLRTGNIPFITTLLKFMNAFESEHKVGLWFFRAADIVNIRWGTRVPITYTDPVYAFPVDLRGYGNFSMRITRVEEFFRQIVAGKENYDAGDLQELLLSRIGQPISTYLATARFSYAEIDGHLTAIADAARERTTTVFEELGFRLLDLRIEGTSFDPATVQRIAGISDVQADVKAAQLAGLDFAQLQKLKALRDAARNEGAAGVGAGLFAGMNAGNMLNERTEAGPDIRTRLKELKALFDDGLIDADEFARKKEELLKRL